MAESRDSSLPDGAKELIDLIKLDQESDEAYEKLRADRRAYCRKIAPVVLDKLAQQIDHDLLYTENGDLILPKLRDIAGQTLSGDSRALTREYSDWWAWETDMLTEELWRLICLRRPFRKVE